MRPVSKGPPPRCLADLEREARRVARETGQPREARDWAPGACAPQIREALHRDQHGLCGYCMQTIGKHGHRDHPPPGGNGGMRIEHLTPRERAPERMYEWRNLLGVCGGRAGAPGGTTFDHCDRARGAQELPLDPTASAAVHTAFSFSRQPPEGLEDEDGVWVLGHTPEAQDTIRVLNLNNPSLGRQRRQVERNIAVQLSQRARGRRPVSSILQRLAITASTPDERGTLPAFAPVVLQYVRRKLRAHEVIKGG